MKINLKYFVLTAFIPLSLQASVGSTEDSFDNECVALSLTVSSLDTTNESVSSSPATSVDVKKTYSFLSFKEARHLWCLMPGQKYQDHARFNLRRFISDAKEESYDVQNNGCLFDIALKSADQLWERGNEKDKEIALSYFAWNYFVSNSINIPHQKGCVIEVSGDTSVTSNCH
ncbi:MAG: hypothetical protein V4482_00525 [Pseudomonadota bacterium]